MKPKKEKDTPKKISKKSAKKLNGGRRSIGGGCEDLSTGTKKEVVM